MLTRLGIEPTTLDLSSQPGAYDDSSDGTGSKILRKIFIMGVLCETRSKLEPFAGDLVVVLS